MARCSDLYLLVCVKKCFRLFRWIMVSDQVNTGQVVRIPLSVTCRFSFGDVVYIIKVQLMHYAQRNVSSKIGSWFVASVCLR